MIKVLSEVINYDRTNLMTNESGKPKDKIHLPILWIHNYFTDDSSINFHDKVFLHFLKECGKK